MFGLGWVDILSSIRRSLALFSDGATNSHDSQHCVREFLFEGRINRGQTAVLMVLLLCSEAPDSR